MSWAPPETWKDYFGYKKHLVKVVEDADRGETLVVTRYYDRRRQTWYYEVLRLEILESEFRTGLCKYG